VLGILAMKLNFIEAPFNMIYPADVHMYVLGCTHISATYSTLGELINYY